MAWETSNRRDRLPKNWIRIRIDVLRRDSPTGSSKDAVCQHLRYDRYERDPVTGEVKYLKCGLPANQVDHIERGDDHSPGNLQSLCEWHHNQKSASEGHAARAAKKLGKKPLKRHPGLIYDE